MLKYSTVTAKAERIALPQIQPFGYGLNVNYTKNTFNAEISSEGALQQNRFRAAFGETASLAYNLLNAALTRQFQISKQNILVKAGVEIFLIRVIENFPTGIISPEWEVIIS